MSINNRKYIQSTGSLLTRLNEESSNNPAMYRDNNMMQQQQAQKVQASYNNPNMHNPNNFNRNPTNQMNSYGQAPGNYGNNMPQYSTGGQQQQQHNMYGNGVAIVAPPGNHNANRNTNGNTNDVGYTTGNF